MEQKISATARAHWGRRLRTGLWIAAAGAGTICLLGVFATATADLVLAPEVFDAASLITLVLAAVALALETLLAPAGRRVWPIVRLLTVPPVLLAALAVMAVMAQPGVVNRVRLADGRQFLLAIGNTPTDVDYQLLQSVDPNGMLWRRAENLTYSEDGRFTEDPALIVSPDGRWLMVRRGGLWTDCFKTDNPLRYCPGTGELPDWQKPDEWIARSASIAALTGMAPMRRSEPKPAPEANHPAARRAPRVDPRL